MTADAELLVQLVNPGRLTAVVDIGLGPVRPDPPYRRLLDRRLCSVITLAPTTDPRTPHPPPATDLETHLPYMAGDGTPAVLRLCEAPGMNSLLAPDPQVLECFGQYAAWGQVVAERPVATRRLDDIAEIGALDLLRIDTQGTELSVFGGGASRLASATVVQTKVCFMPLYKDQPLFADIDEALRAQGFTLHIFDEVQRALIRPMAFHDNPYKTINQGVFCDVVYVRDFTRIGDISTDQLRQLALIAHYCFRSYDLTGKCLEGLMARNEVSPDALGRYVEGMASRMIAR